MLREDYGDTLLLAYVVVDSIDRHMNVAFRLVFNGVPLFCGYR